MTFTVFFFPYRIDVHLRYIQRTFSFIRLTLLKQNMKEKPVSINLFAVPDREVLNIKFCIKYCFFIWM